jgi:hypothetical protein
VTAPAGSAKGSVVASPDGRTFATLASADGVALFELGDLAGPGPLQPALLGTIPVGASFDPGSTHPGIIAVLIGLLGEPTSQAPQVAPSISIQDGSVLRLYAYDGVELRLVAEQGLSAGAQGLIEEEGTYYYFVSQGVLWRGIVGGGPGTVVKLGR